MTVITDYIDQAPTLAQPHLQQIYALLKQLLPDAEERISYGMPTFWQQHNLVHFIANKHHLGFYPTAAPLVELADELDGYTHSKGAIQFPYDRPLPTNLITKLVRSRLAHPETAARHRRSTEAMPPEIQQALTQAGLLAQFNVRPHYQQNDYLRWIQQAKRPATQEKRLQQMLTELTDGHLYMKMNWQTKSKRAGDRQD
ncbi:DUF1801 domain-containing protein [Secundilactobacillus paracollinoides]|uniref:DUF1801 domain-containing protein n=1 Tax=Secundilactobacillus paracollinoides TaxID=240427 RepID=UPI00081BE115|nr:DUF1801 domain-containing protein [Secundilactobacillus paracollinoides]